jgi:hypothetical protein
LLSIDQNYFLILRQYWFGVKLLKKAGFPDLYIGLLKLMIF